MPAKRLLVVGVLAAVAVLGAIADRSLQARSRIEEEADDLDAKVTAQAIALSVEAALVRVERGEAGAHFQLRDEPAARAAFGDGLDALDEEAIRTMAGSPLATPSGLPEAVVAAVTLREARLMREVAGKLFAGKLPVRADDVAGLAAALGFGNDVRAGALEERLRRVPPSVRLPEMPSFRREYLAGRHGRGAVEGWARPPDVEGVRIGYQVSVDGLLELAGVRAPALAARVRVVPAARTEREPGPVPGMALEVRRRERAGLDIGRLRTLLWGAVALACLAVVALERAAEREQRAAARERAFLGAVTHELRTPLTSIRMLAETLEDGRGQPAAYGALVRGECERLEAMVEQVLDASRAGEAPVLRPVDPEEIVRGVASLAAARAERRSVAMRLLLDEPLPRVTWDGDAVRRALLNLVDNAIKHGRAGGHVEISALAAGPKVELRVADDGPGIRRQDRSRIFGRFERGGTDAPGTGLGLYLVEQVARSHGGSVRVESVPDEGATFTLVLPVVPPAAQGSPS